MIVLAMMVLLGTVFGLGYLPRYKRRQRTLRTEPSNTTSARGTNNEAFNLENRNPRGTADVSRNIEPTAPSLDSGVPSGNSHISEERSSEMRHSFNKSDMPPSYEEVMNTLCK